MQGLPTHHCRGTNNPENDEGMAATVIHAPRRCAQGDEGRARMEELGSRSLRDPLKVTWLRGGVPGLLPLPDTEAPSSNPTLPFLAV